LLKCECKGRIFSG